VNSLLLVWAALWRRPAATILIAAATTAAFTLFGSLVGLYATGKHILDSAQPDQLFVLMRYSDDPNTAGLPLAVGAQIERIDGVVSAGAFRWLGGYRANPADQIGIFTVDEGMQGARPDAPITPAQWRLLFSNPNGVLITQERAKTLNLKAGDTFPLTSARGLRADGGRNWEFRVLAVVPEDPQWPNGVVMGNLHYIENSAPPAARSLGYSFWVSIKDPARATQICRAIDRRFFNSPTPTYSISAKQDAQNLARINVNNAGMILSAAAAGIFMILFLVANAVARSVHERLPEFAVLHALGQRESRLRRLVFMEAAFPCLTGAILGTSLAALLAHIPARRIPSNLGTLLSPHLPPTVMLWAFGAATLLALLSSAMPLLKIKRMSVAEILAGR
jgi:ABC-type lipoprotein release transport system permease subunit